MRQIAILTLFIAGWWNPAASLPAADGNRLTYLDDFCDPYYVGLGMPKLETPQWVGEPGVDAVVTLGIDDMKDPEAYEAFLRPILDRLKQIDGRAPVSIMSLSVDPAHPLLQRWLKEGLSLETHTADHPCPCLQRGSFEKAKSTYDRCIDQLAAVPNSRPVAFRFPCMDSQNTPSPRAYAEIVNRTTTAGNFVQISTSVCNVPTAEDPDLPRELVMDTDRRPRFDKYLPFKSFVNKVENYPYPYVIGRLCWEFPCAVPDDWLGQNLQGPNNPATVADFKAAIDAAVAKKGIANFVFHPHGWIRSDQMAEVVDYAARTYGRRVKFLNFRECLQRLKAHLLVGQSLRAKNGQDNGVRLLDVDGDGFMDVVIANENMRRTRIWSPQKGEWTEGDFPAAIVQARSAGSGAETGVRFGVLRDGGAASYLAVENGAAVIWHYAGGNWIRDNQMEKGIALRDEPVVIAREGIDQGVRLRDVDGDGRCEVLVANPIQRGVLQWDESNKTWMPFAEFPRRAMIVDEKGLDAGLRFADLDGDAHDDILFSNERGYAIYRYGPASRRWKEVRAGLRSDSDAVPMIVRAGTNNGAWFADGRMWLQNEDTDRLLDGVQRVSFEELLGTN
jgi:hypothetical protein